MSSRKYIFQAGPSRTGKVIALVVLALVLLLLSTFTDRIDRLRTYVLDWVAGVYRITDVPSLLREEGSEQLQSREQLRDEVARLRNENLILGGKVSTLSAVLAENTRLRQLLNASRLYENRVLIAEVIGVPPNPLTHRLIINRGSSDGAFVGQPVIDAGGLVGQIVRVGGESSELLLISDRSHALSVETLRSGSRLIVEGTGDYGLLQLRDVSPTSDVEVGDALVTSGLGGVFPRGIPVGDVSLREPDQNSPFMHVEVSPVAQLQTSRHLLLLFEISDALESSP